ncbi:tripartite tricarboxylate transporter family receptor [Variibacter gotjawalensis]|uniref:Tripartite tricarboxylate transporter family receptor n=1 Tax=Variibacter gotjawalensis TaxID=1333996 RepID=A0A0S3PSE8_9BRAD|nr:tripartite tricarboxylate transporter substrate-binding protein [Variibacter gotjawalensis]NIK49182.1 tripartite-type tricarboxylate transporter receptor subunit TctC [Variibacter gotjawalensis]RZS51036.1 tripartite-type tricarboxylate transporter receptor subunit TctC [Variibacter gotjawalensis]BAT58870.1 tripartite tricarboxylate transporter family receptor [Variibacter gotjawalensis]
MNARPLHFVVALALLFAATPASAQTTKWPDRPVKLVVPVGAGGAADTLARNLSNGFAQFANGQPLVIENRPGAGGTLAATGVAREQPDGYVLLLAEIGANAAANALQSKLSYDVQTAFTPIIHVANLPTVVLMRPDLPYKSLGELIAAAKQQPGKFNYASAGIGNWTHLFMAYLNGQAGVQMINIPYRSGAEMTTSLLRGEADVAAVSVSTSIAFIREGKVRAVAGFPAKQIPELAETPPASQAVPGFSIDLWHGIVAPAGMDPALVSQINGIFNKVIGTPAVAKAISQAQAAEIVGGSPKQFDDLLKAEQKRWPELIKSAGIKVD